ncbi:hypothetical protein RvY_03776 [Ramazzottius varieornatus]|uniref:Uncharacterized protein n=1 Tax=Ramazzottius varieornatus TaxID=947166 RepID=A0A1D1UPA1_RAMVA|nr:hypothetical protein RvY_03776 [Ramazzottius varieornatus]
MRVEEEWTKVEERGQLSKLTGAFKRNEVSSPKNYIPKFRRCLANLDTGAQPALGDVCISASLYKFALGTDSNGSTEYISLTTFFLGNNFDELERRPQK